MFFIEGGGGFHQYPPFTSTKLDFPQLGKKIHSSWGKIQIQF